MPILPVERYSFRSDGIPFHIDFIAKDDFSHLTKKRKEVTHEAFKFFLYSLSYKHYLEISLLPIKEQITLFMNYLSIQEYGKLDDMLYINYLIKSHNAGLLIPRLLKRGDITESLKSKMKKLSSSTLKIDKQLCKFNAYLRGGKTSEMLKFWSASSKTFKKYFIGSKIKVGRGERRLTFIQLLNNFNLALKSRNQQIISSIWDGAYSGEKPLLKLFYGGETFSVGTADLKMLDKHLIRSFKHVLDANATQVMRFMLYYNNRLILRIKDDSTVMKTTLALKVIDLLCRAKGVNSTNEILEYILKTESIESMQDLLLPETREIVCLKAKSAKHKEVINNLKSLLIFKGSAKDSVYYGGPKILTGNIVAACLMNRDSCRQISTYTPAQKAIFLNALIDVTSSSSRISWYIRQTLSREVAYKIYERLSGDIKRYRDGRKKREISLRISVLREAIEKSFPACKPPVAYGRGFSVRGKREHALEVKAAAPEPAMRRKVGP